MDVLGCDQGESAHMRLGNSRELKEEKSLLIACLLIISLIAPPTFGSNPSAIIHVGGGYAITKITYAIEIADDRDQIIVHEGIYEENLILNKRLTLVARGNVTVIGSNDLEPTVSISSRETVVKGFNLRSGGVLFVAVLKILPDSTSNEVLNNTITNGYFGIQSDRSSGNTIRGNIVARNVFGISFNASSANVFEQNLVSSNKYGILINSGENNIIRSNNLTADEYGIYLYRSKYASITDNELVDDDTGIYLTGFSTDASIVKNTIASSQYGIVIDAAHSNLATDNWIYRSMFGISLTNCRGNIVTRNSVEDGTIGIWCMDTISNTCSLNSIVRNKIGMMIDKGYNDSISGNSLVGNAAHALSLYKSNNVTIEGNSIASSDNGIVLDKSNYNILQNNRVNMTSTGIYLYQSEYNIIRGVSIDNAESWYIRSSSKYYNYATNLLLDNQIFDFRFLGAFAASRPVFDIQFPQNYTYLGKGIFVNVTEGSYLLLNLSYRDIPGGITSDKLAILFTTDNAIWRKPSKLEINESSHVIATLIETSGSYGLFSYSEEKSTGFNALIAIPVLIVVSLLAYFATRRGMKK